jgi:hypothetical protein
VRGWGEYFKRAHARRLFRQLDHWIGWRIRAHRSKRWRSTVWRELPDAKLYGELELARLSDLIPSKDPSNRMSM